MKNRRLEIRLTEDELYEIDNKAQNYECQEVNFYYSQHCIRR